MSAKSANIPSNPRWPPPRIAPTPLDDRVHRQQRHRGRKTLFRYAAMTATTAASPTRTHGR
ncbi:MAG: hypothetical protein WDO73_22855 [Ignavibacteriota bacterium]